MVLLLATSDEHGAIVVEGGVASVQGEPARTVREGHQLVRVASHRDPPRVEIRAVEVVPAIRVDRFRRTRWPMVDLQLDGVDHRPVVDPVDRDEEGLAAEDVEAVVHALRADPQADQPRGPVGGLDQVGVSDVLDRPVGAAVAEDRVGRAAFPRAGGGGALRDGNGMAGVGPALGDEQVPGAVPLVEVGRFRVLQAGAGPRGHRVPRAPRRWCRRCGTGRCRRGPGRSGASSSRRRPRPGRGRCRRHRRRWALTRVRRGPPR